MALATRPTELHQQHCLNSKHRQADCSRCADSCPAQAITVDSAVVSVDFDRCSGCGLCLHDCPAEVFTTSRWNERTVLANVTELQTASVECFCARHPQPATGCAEAGSIQLPTCLAAMSPGVWFELGLQRAVILRLDACVDCPLASTLEAVRSAVNTANNWLCDAGYEARIACAEQAEAGEKRHPVISGDHIRTSRRGFFRSLFGAARRQQETAPPEAEIPWTGDDSPHRAPRLPAWMACAAQAYAQNARPAAANLVTRWPAVSISSACVACGACTDYCPTGALAVDPSADDYQITFLAGKCVDCRICWASCPVGAITRAQQPTPAPFEYQTVFQHCVSLCSHCSRPTLSGQATCYWCAEEPPLGTVLTDARRWLLTTTLAQPQV